MDTKWNNAIDDVYTFVDENKEIIVGIMLLIFGVILEWDAIKSNYALHFEQRFISWIFAIVSLGAGLLLTAGIKLKRRYDNQMEEWDYICWKKAFLKMEKRVSIATGLTAGIAIVLEWCFIRNMILLCTVIVLYLVFQVYYIRFMYKYLNDTMTKSEEINRQKLEKALQKVSRSDKLRMDLITNVSHDLKTPLTSMVGYLELMKKEELSPVVKDYVEVISDKTDKLKEMIESLFSLAKVSSGNVELHMETFQFNRLLEQIMADMKDRIDESELHFVTKLAEEETEITSDNMYCYRICQNLLENALKYSAKGTRVFVKTYLKDESKICLEMTNTAGYPMDFDKEEIMERFARGDKSRSTEGNGLGLAIVSSYARALKGEFDILIDCDQFKAILVLPIK